MVEVVEVVEMVMMLMIVACSLSLSLRSGLRPLLSEYVSRGPDDQRFWASK